MNNQQTNFKNLSFAEDGHGNENGNNEIKMRMTTLKMKVRITNMKTKLKRIAKMDMTTLKMDIRMRMTTIENDKCT